MSDRDHHTDEERARHRATAPTSGDCPTLRRQRAQQQIALPGEMLRGGLGNLRSTGKMNEAIAAVDLRATKDTGAFGFPPQWGGTNFVEYRHRAESGSDVQRRKPSSTIAQADTAKDARRESMTYAAPLSSEPP